MAWRTFVNDVGVTEHVTHPNLAGTYLGLAYRSARDSAAGYASPVPLSQPHPHSIEAVVFSAFFVEAASNWTAIHNLDREEIAEFIAAKKQFHKDKSFEGGTAAWKWHVLLERFAGSVSEADAVLVSAIDEVAQARNDLAHFNPERSATRVVYTRDVVNEDLRNGGFNFTALQSEPAEVRWGAIERITTPHFACRAYMTARRVLQRVVELGVDDSPVPPKLEVPAPPDMPTNLQEVNASIGAFKARGNKKDGF